MRHVPNEQLDLSDVPDPQGDLQPIWDFAHTFNAYEAQGSFEAAAEIANQRRNASLTDLRTCLFFEVRRWRHFGEDPDPDEEHYIRSLVEDIRRHLMRG